MITKERLHRLVEQLSDDEGTPGPDSSSWRCRTSPGSSGGSPSPPDGRRLAASVADGTVGIFTLDRSELLALARDRLTRPFTGAECRQYLHTATCPADG